MGDSSPNSHQDSKIKKEEEDPPDSLKLEPKKEIGSFFVGNFLKIEVISDLEQCYKLWQEFSPMRNLFDTWEFRYAFYLGYQYQPYFLLLKKNGENLGILPLWYEDNNFHNKNKKRFVWFGSDWQEETSFYVKDKDYIPILISAAPSPLYLNAISKEGLNDLISKIPFQKDEPKYILNLRNFKNHEDFLMTLKKNTRRNLRKDRNRILKQNPEIVINNFSDFKYLVELAKNRFSQKGEKADWEDPRRIKTFEKVIELAGKSYQLRMLTIKIGEKIAGVDLICILNNTYFTVKCGYDVAEFSGIGNFINLFEIDDAIKLGMKKIDFLQNNYEWKAKYFKAVPLLKYAQ
jgi:hypothetical protein